MNTTKSIMIIIAVLIGIYLVLPTKQPIPIEKERCIIQNISEQKYKLYFNGKDVYHLNSETGTVKKLIDGNEKSNWYYL